MHEHDKICKHGCLAFLRVTTHHLLPFLSAAYYRLRRVDSVCLLLHSFAGRACGTTEWTFEPKSRLELCRLDLNAKYSSLCSDTDGYSDIRRMPWSSLSSIYAAVRNHSLFRGLNSRRHSPVTRQHLGDLADLSRALLRKDALLHPQPTTHIHHVPPI